MAIASIDYVKRPEVLPAVLSCLWDVVLVDEAHAVAGDSERRRAVDALAGRAVYVVMLSATPHSGDQEAFEALCRMGRAAEPVLVFRRTRADVSMSSRRKVRRLIVRTSAAERQVHALVGRFIEAIVIERGEHVRLLASVLEKRACSSVRALECSIERRLSALTPEGTNEGGPIQLALPLTEAGESTDDDNLDDWHPDVRLDDPLRERRLLEELAAATRAAVASETKIAAVARLLRRAREPALVFTEYRDTLLHVAARLSQRSAVLHGGLTRRERASALDRFAAGDVDLLLATDAAGEGLNLQQRCRLVVNFELPWNPMRLEQRIGRVDRIGQRRTVHVVHLVAHDTAEIAVLDRLRDKIGRAQQAIDAANPLDAWPAFRAGDSRLPVEAGDDVQRVDLRDDCALEATRIAAARRIGAAHRDRISSLPGAETWISRTRTPATRALLQGRTLTIVAVTMVDEESRPAESMLFGVLAPRGWSANAAESSENISVWSAAVRDVHARFIASRLAREGARLARTEAETSGELQPGLFDRRAELTRAAFDDDRERVAVEMNCRIEALRGARSLEGPELTPVLVLVP